MKANRRRAASIIGLTLVTLGAGCAQRKLTVTSEPSGALVYLNEREAGRTPFTTDIGWYGTYDVVVRKEGYQTLTTKRRVIAPWWGWPPIDLLAELAPWHPTDHQKMSFALSPTDEGDATGEALVRRGLELKAQLPATQPAGAVE